MKIKKLNNEEKLTMLNLRFFMEILEKNLEKIMKMIFIFFKFKKNLGLFKFNLLNIIEITIKLPKFFENLHKKINYKRQFLFLN